jgi:hypothetical protein
MNRVLQYGLLVDSFPLMIWSVHFSSASRPMSLRGIKEPGTLDHACVKRYLHKSRSLYDMWRPKVRLARRGFTEAYLLSSSLSSTSCMRDYETSRILPRNALIQSIIESPSE